MNVIIVHRFHSSKVNKSPKTQHFKRRMDAVDQGFNFWAIGAGDEPNTLLADLLSDGEEEAETKRGGSWMD